MGPHSTGITDIIRHLPDSLPFFPIRVAIWKGKEEYCWSSGIRLE
ncbi:MAG TPA: hypothetical protein VJ350_01915 [Methanoregula sp.]|nr:hypothetical protein [Methanoregula sp.]